MRNYRFRNTGMVILMIILMGGFLILAGCEDEITALIEEEVRLAGLPEYTLTIREPAVGSVTPSGNITVKHGEPLGIFASVPTGYSFVNWEIEEGAEFTLIADENSESTTVTLAGGNAVIKPVISDTLYDLTMTNDGNGTTDPSGTVQVANGQPRTVTAIPDSANGYEFDQWVQTGGTGTASIDSPTSATTAVTVTGGAVTIEAQFKLKSYTITLTNDGNGTTSPISSITVTHGQASSTISATPDSGYVFSSWTVTSGSGITFNSGAGSSSTTITATAGDATVQANFVLDTYSLTLTSTANGSVISPPSPTTVTHGVPQSILASNPSARGYYFSGWTQTGGAGTAVFGNAANQSTTVTVTDDDVTIRANFSAIAASLTLRGSLNLNGSPYTEQRLTVVQDLVFHDDYVYAAGSTPGLAMDYAKVMKIDVSNPSSPAWSASTNVTLNSDSNEIIVEGSYLYLGVDGSGADRWRSTISTGSGINSFIDLGHNTRVYHVTGDGWISDNTEISKYYVQGTYDVGSDDPINDILYIPDFDYLYVTRAAGMSSSGYAEVFYALSDNIYLESSDTVSNKSPGKMVFNGPENIYAASGGDGLITFYVDYEVFEDITSFSANSSTTGNPIDVAVGDNGNYLFSIGTGTSDKIAIFDVHGNNGSVSNPYYLYSLNSPSSDIKALDVAGNYLYLIDGTTLHIYEITVNTL